MGKKYEFTGEVVEYRGHILRQIRAIVNFCMGQSIDIPEGCIGGWIEDEANLPNTTIDFSWVGKHTYVIGNSVISKNSSVGLVEKPTLIIDSSIIDSCVRAVVVKDSIIVSSNAYKSKVIESDIYRSQIASGIIIRSTMTNNVAISSKIKHTEILQASLIGGYVKDAYVAYSTLYNSSVIEKKLYDAALKDVKS